MRLFHTIFELARANDPQVRALEDMCDEQEYTAALCSEMLSPTKPAVVWHHGNGALEAFTSNGCFLAKPR